MILGLRSDTLAGFSFNNLLSKKAIIFTSHDPRSENYPEDQAILRNRITRKVDATK